MRPIGRGRVWWLGALAGAGGNRDGDDKDRHSGPNGDTATETIGARKHVDSIDADDALSALASVGAGAADERPVDTP